MAKSWYFFFGGQDPFKSANYIRLPDKHFCLCGKTICAIYAEGKDRHPAVPLSSNIQSYIEVALKTHQLQPEFPPMSKKYVYLKDY